MSRTNIDVDEAACRAVMNRYGLATKREAVNFALRTLAAEPLTVDEARRLRGSAIRADVPVLHADADFDALARYTPLQVDPL